MDWIIKNMDKTIMNKMGVSKSELFRTPLGLEKNLGLWLDRIGEGVSSERPEKMRILGLYAVVYIVRGEGYYISGTSDPMAVKAGDVMLVYPDIPTVYYPRGEWSTIWIVWGGPEAQQLEKTGYLKEYIFHDKDESVGKAYMSLMKLRISEDIESILERKKILIQMILDLYRCSKAEATIPRNMALMNTLIDRISENPTEEYSIESMASECNVSPTHFRRLFQTYAGSSPKEFIISMRISLAKRLLSEGKSIKEVAELSGFNDMFYFMRAFKKMTGITAGRFSRS